MSRLLCQTELPRRGPSREGRRSPLTESNRRPSPYHGDALPTELRGREPDEDTGPRGLGTNRLRPPAAGAPGAGVPHARRPPAESSAGGRRRVAGEGFEPSKAKPTDLQSAPIGRSGNLPGVPPGDPERIARVRRRPGPRPSAPRCPRGAAPA